MTFQVGEYVTIKPGTEDADKIIRIIGEYELPDGSEVCSARIIEVTKDRTRVEGPNGEFWFLNERFEKVWPL